MAVSSVVLGDDTFDEDGIGGSKRTLSFTSHRSSSYRERSSRHYSRRSRSARDDSEDEEALKWAALEKLPTFTRMRTAILENKQGNKVHRVQVDLRTLDQDRIRQEIISKLFDEREGGTHDDSSKFLTKLRERIDRVGIRLPTVEVRYENLNIEAKVHVGGRALPNLFNAVVNAVEGGLAMVGLNLTKKTNMTILHNVSGIIKPGRMTLLLGPPSSGKTTLLLALAGKLDTDVKMTGRVTYNGFGLDEFVPQKTSAYVSQYDLHVGQMTVRETFEYSAKCQDVGPRRYELLTELTRREKELGIYPEADIDYYMKAAAMKETGPLVLSEYVLKILGLDICSDTIVGDAMMRGISGGQKKRVTTGEMMVGPMKTLFMDEISTGLDSSTTFQIVKYLREITHKLEATLVVSLLQPAPETYDLFDDVILLSEGQIVYHGPREDILEFFEGCGFKCPERKGVADFLQEVTSRKDQEQYWVAKQSYEFVPVKVFAEAFKASQNGVKMVEELKTPFDKSKGHEAALTFNRYSLSTIELLKINFAKESLLIRRNAFIYIFKTCQIGLMALIGVSVYVRTRMHRNNFGDAQVFSGALFYGILNVMFNGYAELSLTISRLPVFYKQRDMLFFPAWSFTLASWILSIPISIIETFMWVTITYYSMGFAPAASRYFRQLFLYFWVHQMSSSLFHLIAGVCRSEVLSNTGGTFCLLAIFIMGGFLIKRTAIRAWWIWGYWALPLSYAQNGASVLEFLSPQWDKTIGNFDKSLGVRYLKSVGLFARGYWYWIAVGALIGYTALFNLLFTLSLTYLGPLGKKQAVISKTQIAEAHANLTGEIILPSAAEATSLRSHKRSIPRSLSRSQTGSTAKAINLVARKSGLSRLSGTNVDDINENGSGREASADGPAAPASRTSNTFGNRVSHSSARTSDIELDGITGVPTKRGMTSLPFQPLAMSFDDLNYYVDMPAQMKAQGLTEGRLQLLRGITGAFRPGVLTALMGVSGAGKTTFMDVLAGRKTGGYIEGDVRVAGFPKNQATFARISGYCEQTDIHSPQVTVHESLTYSAWLRLGQEVDDETKEQFVLEVMDLVELTSLKDALVGLPGVTGLSTEQRKRLTIAVELVANPSIIFMDEPTSGLDARAAAIVMRTVRNTVDTGRTVVCTIHQPSIDIFDAFDELLLLKRGGQVIYAGPLGKHANKLLRYFEVVPGVPRIKEGYNPATWMLEVTSPAVEQRLGVDFAQVYEKSALFQRNKALVRELKKLADAPDAKDLWFSSQYSQNFWSQVRSCLWKQQLTYWRSPDYNNVRLLFTSIAALLFGTVFWQVGKKRGSQENITTIAGAMAGAVIFTGINNSATVQPIVATERTVFYRERAAGMYSAGPYAIAQVLIELPYCLFQTMIYSVLTYSMIGLSWTAAKFFWYFYFMFFTFAYFTFYGMMAVGITPNAQVSAIVAASFYQIWNLFSGYLVLPKKLPKWTIWYYWICPLSWTLYGLIVSQFGDVHTYLELNDGSSNAQQQTVSEFLDDQFGFKHSFLPVVAVMHLVFPVLFAFIFMLSIKYLNFQTR